MSPSPNPLFRPFIGGGTVDAAAPPALTSTIAMPGAVNVPASIGASLPSVSSAPTAPAPLTQTQTDINEYNRQKNTGSGVDQIQNPLLKGIAKAGDILGSVFAPNLAQFIPGTTLHHQLTMNQAANNAQKDQQEEQNQAKTQQEEALATQETAKAAQLTNPQKAIDASKTVTTDDGVFQLNPDTGKYDVRVGDRVDKPKSPEQSAYDAAFAQTGDAMKAFTAVKQASNTKNASLQQQFLDGYKKAHPEASDTDAIAATIRATSTEPKLTVINAAAADRNATKNAGLDTSDPAMQASVNAVAKGDLKLSDVFGRGATTNQKAQFAAAVKAVNPNYNSGDHDIENAVRRDFSSGHDSNTLNAINTAYNHLDKFAQAAQALKNGNSKAMNEMANTLGVQFQNGTSPQVISDLVKQALKGEVSRAFTGVGATVDEQHNLDTSFSNANSLDTMLGVVNETKGLLKGKESTLRSKFDSGTQGKPSFIGDSGPSAATHTYNLKTGKIEAIQ